MEGTNVKCWTLHPKTKNNSYVQSKTCEYMHPILSEIKNLKYLYAWLGLLELITIKLLTEGEENHESKMRK